ncbi:uncharacterized protein LOC127849601 isoform X1 [Dreissena polymorpha]|uniref:ShKT domain-containing protein n=2 Tax=Dreissena polymorpha TaxID=45954 RepID=A0A9D4D6W0_DREPO|nr:uncharacterized protein LOC127849601 isoform X1 [Dreissena polymorpha]KAH3738981.1 hypothetical protein DPMN_045625 [Dreissena polymorpha]
MSMPFVITCCILLLISSVHSQNACADLDTQACARMHATQPGLCETSLADSACPEYCGKCSTLPPQTTTVLLTTTTKPCEDIDTLACQKMQQSKPDLCLDDSLAELACKRFCGRCPVECYSCPTLVRSLSECRATTTCQVSEACYVMEVFDFDASHGFRAGCMPKDLCIPHNNELMVGRSSSTVHTSCCDTDRCNIPPTTTTTTTTATTTHRTPNSHCLDNAIICRENKACIQHPFECPRKCGICH